MNSLTFARVLERMGACYAAVDFVKYCWRSGLRDAQEVWCICDDGHWMAWLCDRLDVPFSIYWRRHSTEPRPCLSCLAEADDARSTVDWGLIEERLLKKAKELRVR